MDVLVAVAACVFHSAVAQIRAGDRIAQVVQRSWMPCAEMAALAEVGSLACQHLVVVETANLPRGCFHHRFVERDLTIACHGDLIVSAYGEHRCASDSWSGGAV